MERRVLIFWHLAAHAARGFIKTTHIPYFDYSSFQNTISQLVQLNLHYSGLYRQYWFFITLSYEYCVLMHM